jgi:adenylylsulfate kinase
VVFWMTGLSGAGKSTIAQVFAQALRERGVLTAVLDGDALRAVAPTGFTRTDRDAHARRAAQQASELSRHGTAVICALISPYAASRQAARDLCDCFVEVYLSTPLDECERRDPKGLYARARRGEIDSFTGVSDPYEPPPHPDVTLDTSHVPVEDAVAQLMAVWESKRRPQRVRAA